MAIAPQSAAAAAPPKRSLGLFSLLTLLLATGLVMAVTLPRDPPPPARK